MMGGCETFKINGPKEKGRRKVFRHPVVYSAATPTPMGQLTPVPASPQ